VNARAGTGFPSIKRKKEAEASLLDRTCVYGLMPRYAPILNGC
jgi:hypothetical protein